MTDPARDYPDLHDHIEALKKAGLLIVVDRTINKDTEMHSLVRWQFRGGIPEEDRKAFLFTSVTDSKGRAFDIPVLVCGLAGSRAIDSLGMQCAIDEIRDTWIRAMTHPIPPTIVTSAPGQEIVYEGAALRSGHGLDDLPVPISTPGWDNAPYTSSSHFITRDPETGTQNMGNYRAHLVGEPGHPERVELHQAPRLRSGADDPPARPSRHQGRAQGGNPRAPHLPAQAIVIQFDKGVPPTEIWRALYGVASFRRAEGKWVVAVDTDIDPDNSDAIFWAMSYRGKPHRDVQMLLHKDEGHGPRSMIDHEDSAVLINAVLKETFPPISLPKKEYMEGARKIWEEMGLPRLRPEMPMRTLDGEADRGGRERKGTG